MQTRSLEGLVAALAGALFAEQPAGGVELPGIDEERRLLGTGSRRGRRRRGSLGVVAQCSPQRVGDQPGPEQEHLADDGAVRRADEETGAERAVDGAAYAHLHAEHLENALETDPDIEVTSFFFPQSTSFEASRKIPFSVDADGRKVYLFEKRDQPRIEAEPSMPDADEIVPSARFYQRGSWENVNLDAMEILGRFHRTPILDAKAKEVTARFEGNLNRARALYEFVNEEIKGNAGGWGPTGTLLERSGNRLSEIRPRSTHTRKPAAINP